MDPIDKLLTATPLISVPVSTLAVGAIGTTLIGTYLTCSQFCADLICFVRGDCSQRDLRASQAATVAVPVALAFGGPRVFYLATAAAGAILYVLWGIIPAASAALLRYRGAANGDNFSGGTNLLPTGWIGGAALGATLLTSFVMVFCQLRIQLGF